VLGKHTGRHAVEAALESLGYELTGGQITEITERIKELSAKQKRIAEDDIIAIADDAAGRNGSGAQPVSIERFWVHSSTGDESVAKAVLLVNGVRRSAVCTGIGSVDASSKAILSALGMPITVKEYNLKGVTGGTDALANALMRISDGGGREFTAEAVHEDVVTASVNALVKGVNKSVNAQAQRARNGEGGAAKEFSRHALDTARPQEPKKNKVRGGGGGARRPVSNSRRARLFPPPPRQPVAFCGADPPLRARDGFPAGLPTFILCHAQKVLGVLLWQSGRRLRSGRTRESAARS
jgi:hypothetical protein